MRLNIFSENRLSMIVLGGFAVLGSILVVRNYSKKRRNKNENNKPIQMETIDENDINTENAENTDNTDSTDDTSDGGVIEV